MGTTSVLRVGDGASERAATTDETAVLAAHEQFWQSYARRDLDGRFAVVAEDVTLFGTARHERIVGKTIFRAINENNLQQYPSVFRIEHIWQEVRQWREVAWVEANTILITGEGNASTRDIVRTTTILKREAGGWWVAHLHVSDPDYRFHEGEYMMDANIHSRNKELEREVLLRTDELLAEKKRSEDLLLNILPAEVANELKDTGAALAKHFDNATILFTDFTGFTRVSELLSPQELVEELNTCFKAFDHIITAREIEKIKTIGDAYMCASGLPDPKASSTADVVYAGLEMQAFMVARKKERDTQGLPAFEMRAGIHTGAVVAGIVGVKKFQYDIWGDTVNIASRMESTGAVGQVNISGVTHILVKDHPGFRFTPRGLVQAKGKGGLEMYYVEKV